MSQVSAVGDLCRSAEAGDARDFEQEATEAMEMESILCLLGYLLLVWDSRHIRPDAADLFSCV